MKYISNAEENGRGRGRDGRREQDPRAPGRRRKPKSPSQAKKSQSLLYAHHDTMRPLTEDESKAIFTKLANYIVRASSCCFFSCLTSAGQKSRPPHRQARRAILLSTAQGPRLLCLRIVYETRHLRRAAKSGQHGDLSWKVQQEREVQAAHNLPRLSRPVREVQGGQNL